MTVQCIEYSIWCKNFSRDFPMMKWRFSHQICTRFCLALCCCHIINYQWTRVLESPIFGKAVTRAFLRASDVTLKVIGKPNCCRKLTQYISAKTTCLSFGIYCTCCVSMQLKTFIIQCDTAYLLWSRSYLNFAYTARTDCTLGIKVEILNQPWEMPEIRPGHLLS